MFTNFALGIVVACEARSEVAVIEQRSVSKAPKRRNEAERRNHEKPDLPNGRERPKSENLLKRTEMENKFFIEEYC